MTMLLEGRDLHKTYRLIRRISLDALRGVDVSIATGELGAILRASGCGKSTLMPTLGLLHPPDTHRAAPRELRFAGAGLSRLAHGHRGRTRGERIGSAYP